jgi:hypothetical protein
MGGDGAVVNVMRPPGRALRRHSRDRERASEDLSTGVTNDVTNVRRGGAEAVWSSVVRAWTRDFDMMGA